MPADGIHRRQSTGTGPVVLNVAQVMGTRFMGSPLSKHERNPVSKHQIQPEYGDEQADAGRDCRTPSRETKFSGVNGDRGIFIFPVQLTTSRIGNPTRLILTLAVCDHHIYILGFQPNLLSNVSFD